MAGLDRIQWLTANKLEDAIAVFEARNVEIEELLEFDEHDIKAFATQVLQLDVLARNRFIKAIAALKKQHNDGSNTKHIQTNVNTGHNNDNIDFSFNFLSNDANAQSHVIASAEEHNAKERLYERNNEIAKLCYDITVSNDTLQQSYMNVLTEIEIAFNLLNNELNKRKQTLLTEIDITETQKYTQLKQQLSSIEQHIPVLNDTKKKFYTFMEDRNIDIRSRKKTVLKLISNALEKHSATQLHTTPNVQFNIPQKALNTFMNHMEINNYDQPHPPVITIKKCSATGITLQWKYNNMYPPNAIQIHYAVLSKSVDTHMDESGSEHDGDSDTDMEHMNDKRKYRQKRVLTLKLPHDVDTESLKWKTVEIKKINKYNCHVITELHHDRLYVFRARCGNDNGWGTFSEYIVGETEKPTFLSKIMKSSEQRKLMSILKKNKKCIRIKGKKMKKDIGVIGWKLLYRASKYGYNSNEFYRKCVGKTNTLVVIESEANHVFGGYVNVAWMQPPTGNWVYGQDDNCFLFILRSSNKSDIGGYTTMKHTSQYAMCCWDQYGPCFGQNCEIAIANACNTNTGSYSTLGTFIGITHNAQLAGGQNFKVREYEVWQLQQ